MMSVKHRRAVFLKEFSFVFPDIYYAAGKENSESPSNFKRSWKISASQLHSAQV